MKDQDPNSSNNGDEGAVSQVRHLFESKVVPTLAWATAMVILGCRKVAEWVQALWTHFRQSDFTANVKKQSAGIAVFAGNIWSEFRSPSSKDRPARFLDPEESDDMEKLPLSAETEPSSEKAPSTRSPKEHFVYFVQLVGTLLLKIWRLICFVIIETILWITWPFRFVFSFTIIRVALWAAMLGSLIPVLVCLHYIEWAWSQDLSNISRMPLTSTVYDRHGQLIQRLYNEHRVYVKLEDVPDVFLEALIATEDERYYYHPGVDPISIIRAVLFNLQNKRVSSGASTITQQLARNSVKMFEKTLDRKLKEAFLAFRIEQMFTKDEIMEMYLNRIFFGRNFHGIGAASDGYFGKKPADLSAPEAALLAGLISSPNANSPYFYPERAKAARAVALSRMADHNFITREEAQEMAEFPIVVREPIKIPGSYILDAVYADLPPWMNEEMIFQGGLKIYTTIDQRVQKIAEEQLDAGLTEIESWRSYRHAKRKNYVAPQGDWSARPKYLQGVFVAVHNKDSGILALVGGRNHEESSFNRALLSRRQVGSSIKPLVYTHAFNTMNFTAFTMVDASPFELTTVKTWPIYSTAGIEEGGGWMSLRDALQRSNNYAAMRAGLAGDPERFAHFIKTLTDVEIPPYPSSCLGACELTALELVKAYTIFPNYGVLRMPYIVSRVETHDGRVIYQHDEYSFQAISPQIAFQMNDVMQGVVNHGTAKRLRHTFQMDGQMGGKTGTTNDYKDAWFSGFSSEITAAVWVGMDEPKTIMHAGYSSKLAVPVWGRIMKPVNELYPPKDFLPPRGVVQATRSVTMTELVDEGEEEGQFLFFRFKKKKKRAVTSSVGRSEWIRNEQKDLALARLTSGVKAGGSGIYTRSYTQLEPIVIEANAEEQEEEEARPRRRSWWNRLFASRPKRPRIITLSAPSLESFATITIPEGPFAEIPQTTHTPPALKAVPVEDDE